MECKTKKYIAYKIKKTIPWFLVSVIFLVATKTVAAVATAPYQVIVNVINYCTVLAGSLEFGRFNGEQIDANSDIYITCSSGTNYSIGINNGANYSAPYRRMTDGSGHYLNYQLYNDEARTTVWDLSGGVVTGIATGGVEGFSVYGRLFYAPSYFAGYYTDSPVSVVVSY